MRDIKSWRQIARVNEVLIKAAFSDRAWGRDFKD